MSQKINKQNLVLPPNVNGNYNGYLEVKIEGFKWRGNKTFNLIQAKILFWGQESDKAGTIWFNTEKGKSEPESLKYRIVTTTNLFKSYLEHAEPLHIKLLSLKTEKAIGASAIRIPVVIKHLKADDTGKILATDSSPIFSSQGFVLGSIFTTFRVRLVHPVNETIVIETVKSEDISQKMPTNIKFRKSIPIPVLEDNYEILKSTTVPCKEKNQLSEFFINNVPSITCSDYTTASYSLNDYSNTQKTQIFNYLLGKNVPENAEEIIIKDILNLSPAGSLLEMIGNQDFLLQNSNPIPQKLGQITDFSKSQILKNIDSIRFAIRCFLATKSGIKEIVKKFNSNNMKTFNLAIECQISTGPVKSTDNNTMYFLSKSLTQNDLIHRIEINKQNYRALNNPKEFFAQQNISLTFLVWIRDAVSKISYILGAARVPLGQFLTKNLSYSAKVAVKLVNSETVVGILSFDSEVGCRKVMFESNSELGVKCNQENGDKENSDRERNQQPNQYCNQRQSVPGNNQHHQTSQNRAIDDNSAPTKVNIEEKNCRNGNNVDVMNSLLYFGAVRDGHESVNLDIQLSYFDLFTNESVKTSVSSGNAFNFLKVNIF